MMADEDLKFAIVVCGIPHRLRRDNNNITVAPVMVREEEESKLMFACLLSHMWLSRLFSFFLWGSCTVVTLWSRQTPHGRAVHINNPLWTFYTHAYSTNLTLLLLHHLLGGKTFTEEFSLGGQLPTKLTTSSGWVQKCYMTNLWDAEKEGGSGREWEGRGEEEEEEEEEEKHKNGLPNK